MTYSLRLALNHSAHSASASAHAVIALASEGKAPEWIHLLPPGPVIEGRDGRAWRMDDPHAVIAAFNMRNMPLPLDFEHGSEMPATGQPVPTAGWIEELDLRDGSVWGRVQWTNRGREAVENREYRFVSPAFYFEPSTGEVITLLSAGLVHRPNLELAALNKEQEHMLKKIAKALGLPETATEAECLTAINALDSDKATALNAAENPPLSKYVPRADYDQMATRATNAEQQVKDAAQAAKDAEAAAIVEDGIKEGKIAPASKEHFLKMAKNSMEDVKAFIASAPVLLKPGAEAGLDKADPAAGGNGTLTDNHKAMCARLGLTETEYAKALS